MPQETSRPGSSHMRLGSGKRQSATCIPSFVSATEVDPSPMLNAKSLEPICIYPCIKPRQLITLWISDSDEEMVMARASQVE
jgi:hypothetical protein